MNNQYVWDIETCLKSECEKKKELKKQEHKCWLSGIYSVADDSEVAVDTSISTAFLSMIRLAQQNKQVTLWAHNAIYDVSYLKHFLLMNGYKQYIPVFDEEGNETTKPKQKSFYIVETEQHQFYSIKITLEYYSKTKAYTITINDSLKKIPLPVKVIAKAWDLETLKGEIDYNLIREDDHVPTEEELEYLKNDCVIVTQVLRDFFNQGYLETTISSTAFNEFKNNRYLGKITEWADKKEKESGKRVSNSAMNKAVETAFRNDFPIIDKELDSFLRRAYKGGITYVNPSYKGDITHKINHLSGVAYDVNSLYPSVMYDNLLPYGDPVFYKGKGRVTKAHPIYIQKVYIKKAVRKGGKNAFPFVQIKDKKALNSVQYKATEYLTRFEDVEFVLTNVELEDILKHYQVSGIKYIEGYKFKASRDIFKSYIDKWIDVKKNAAGGKRQIAKLMLNSLYGKFASKTDRCTLENFMDKDGIVKTKIAETHSVDSNYSPMASFITAYARRFLINAVTKIPFKDFYYCDTDSIHVRNNHNYEELIDVDVDESGELSLWKKEIEFQDSKYLGAKKYMELPYERKGEKIDPSKPSDHWDVKCCGLPQEVRDTIKSKKEFEYGTEFNNKKRSMNGVGGLRIITTSYKLRELTLFA